MRSNWILEKISDLGFFLDPTPYYLNLIGVRNLNARVNYFDGWLGYITKSISPSIGSLVSQAWEVNVFPGTTFPGKDFLLKPVNKLGTAILVAGQYRNTYILGTHKGKPAFRQYKPVKVFRDSNLNSVWDMEPATVHEGMFGINIHRAGIWSRFVGPYSAGCQVYQRSADFEHVLKKANIAYDKGQKEFTYTLIEF